MYLTDEECSLLMSEAAVNPIDWWSHGECPGALVTGDVYRKTGRGADISQAFTEAICALPGVSRHMLSEKNISQVIDVLDIAVRDGLRSLPSEEGKRDL